MLRYAITDRTLLTSGRNTPHELPDDASSRPSSAIEPDTLVEPESLVVRDALVARCAALARAAPLGPGGIDLLLIRERDLPAGVLTDLCRRIASAVRPANPSTRILVSGRADIALAANLDGVHLSAHPGELAPIQIRTLFSGRLAPFISASCHTLAEVHAARAAPVTHQPNAILFAPVFGKSIAGQQVTPATGLPALAEACRVAAPIPVFALGGINAKNTTSCIDAGVAGIAAIRLFMTPPA